MPVPHKLLRRLLLAPLVCLLDAAAIVASPVLLLLAILASPFAGGWRPVRLLAIGVGGATFHLGATIACLGLWIASGFGWKMDSQRMQRAHYVVMRWFVAGVYRTVVRAARVEVVTRDSSSAEEALSQRRRPAIVMSRHAGEGDTLLVMHQLLSRYGRGPRVVMHEALRLDPLIDSLGGRLPNSFLDPRGGDTEREIEMLAQELGDMAALVIFPEGGNFSRARRQKAIERLERAGRDDQAERARGMRHVTAPRPGGSLAAIAGAPQADIVVMGHVGFPNGLRELWRLLPERQTVEVRMWLVPAEEIPDEHEARIDWLFGRWSELDDWIEERARAAPAQATP